MTYPHLARSLAEESERVMQRWRDEVRRDPMQPACRRGLEGRVLDDHLPSLLGLLVGCLRGEEASGVEKDGAEHGHQRRRLGYTVGELIDEIILFKGIFLAAVEGCIARSELDLDEAWAVRSRLIDLVDRSLKASVERIVLEAETERNDAVVRLTRKNAELDEVNTQKDLFLAVLSHELRNPLSAILSASQVIRLLAGAEGKVAKHVDIIERQGRHAARLIEDLLDLSRISRGKVRLEMHRIDLRDPVRTAVETSRADIDAKGVRCDVRLAEGPVAVVADETRLTQVAVNLIANAAKFTPTGGEISVEVVRDDAAVLRVRDTGRGIPPDLLTAVFEPFRQASSAAGQGGLGVGLMVAKSLVELQGGRIEARSEGRDLGTEMIVRLPLAE